MLTPQAGVQVDRFDAPTDWQYSFPEGYTRLEYLESTGVQWIDTGVVRNLEHTYRMVGSVNYPTDVTTRQCQGVQGYFYFGTVNGHWQVAQSGNVNTNIICQINTFHQYNILFNPSESKAIYQIDNHSGNVGITYTNEPQNAHICLFSLNNGILPCSCKNKQILIYQDEILVRNFVPAKRNSDNKPGMYDLVNNVFYVNQGSGADFLMGKELYRNKTQIDLRSKVNMDYTTNYEFNSNNELTWANPDICLKGPVNYTKVGSPIIVDNVVSGFSATSYLKVDNIFSPGNNPWEIVVKTNIVELNVIQNVIGPSSSYNVQLAIRNNNVLRLYLTYNGTSISVQQTSTKTISSTGNVWFKIYFIGTAYKVDVSYNGQDYENFITYSNSNIIYQSSPSLTFGYNNIQPSEYLRGSIDLKETYIKVNGQMWFYGKNYSTSNIAVVPAGLAYNNTTTPSKGYVDMRTQVFTPAPEGVTYKRERHLQVVAPENNTISLLYGVHSSKYKLFGLLAQVSSGSYDVYIDDILYGTYTSNTQTDIDFSQLGPEYVPIGTATTPEALTLHKIVIKPNTSGSTITSFHCARTAGASGEQNQGVLWGHFELSNAIQVGSLMYSYNSYQNLLITAITAKNDIPISLSAAYTQRAQTVRAAA